MPRQIIDTETSRPRYVRRVVLTTVAVAVAVVVVLALLYVFWLRPHVTMHALSRNVILPACILATDPLKENPCYDA